MIEAALYFALGALSVSLLLFAILPIVSRRARRLAIHELERQAPVSLSEITAQKDQMRARFAVELNRQEKRADQLKAETHQHLINAEKWRAYAQRIELDFEQLTSDYAALKKKFSSAELNLQKQKEIAKSALKTMTGQEKKRLFALEEEVDQLRAEKSTASVRIVSLQTELSNAQSRITGMERHMPSLEELSLRKELKALAEDVSQYIRSRPPPAATPAKPVSEKPDTPSSAVKQPSANTPGTQPDRPDAALLVKAPPKFPLMTPAIQGASTLGGSKAKTGGPVGSTPEPAETHTPEARKPQSDPAPGLSGPGTADKAPADKTPVATPASRQATSNKTKGNDGGENSRAIPPGNAPGPVPSSVSAAVAGNNKKVIPSQSNNNTSSQSEAEPASKTVADKPTAGQPVPRDASADGSGKSSRENNSAGTNANGNKAVADSNGVTKAKAKTAARQSDTSAQPPNTTVEEDKTARGAKVEVVPS